MNKKSKERLLWALRYVICHPDISPSILSEEWHLSIDEAIEICSKNASTVVCDFGFGKGKRSLENIEKKIFAKLVELK